MNTFAAMPTSSRSCDTPRVLPVAERQRSSTVTPSLGETPVGHLYGARATEPGGSQPSPPPCLCGIRSSVEAAQDELAAPTVLLQGHALSSAGMDALLVDLHQALEACEARREVLQRELQGARQRLVSAALAAVQAPGGESAWLARCPACECELDDALCAVSLCPYAASSAAQVPALLRRSDSNESQAPGVSASATPSPGDVALKLVGAVFGSASSSPALSPVLDTAVQLLKLHPLDAAPIVTIISDCVAGLPDSAEYGSTLMQLVRHDTSVAVVHLGSCSGVHSSLGAPPDRDGIKFITDCTGGFRCRFKELVAWSAASASAASSAIAAVSSADESATHASPRSEWDIVGSVDATESLVEVGGGFRGPDAPPFSVEHWTLLQRRLLVRPSFHRLQSPDAPTATSAAAPVDKSFIDEARDELVGLLLTRRATRGGETLPAQKRLSIGAASPAVTLLGDDAPSPAPWRSAPSWGGSGGGARAAGALESEPLSSTYNFRESADGPVRRLDSFTQANPPSPL